MRQTASACVLIVSKRSRKEVFVMWDKFGEFDTFSEINELAENLFNEGDLESIRVLAQENGIPADLADLYMEGELPCLCDALTAAAGKIDVEAESLKIQGLMLDWADYIKAQCMENQILSYKVREKGKSLAGCIADLLKEGFSNQWTVPKAILSEAKVTASKVTFGVPNMARAKQIITEYYMR